jgi:Domain of unknown function (DUF5069)
MSPLDLTQAPPRSPKTELHRLIMLPRMIDIARAKLPGGKVGEYQIGRGMSALVLQSFKLNADQFVRIVSEAQSDEDVYEKAGAGDHSKVNRVLQRLKVSDVPPDLRVQFEAFYGAEQARDRRVVDLIEEDDARAFPKK